MSESKLSPFTNSSGMPSLDIYRPVLNISEAYERNFTQIIDSIGLRPYINNTVIKVELSPLSCAEIVAPAEIRWFQERLGIVATNEDNDLLADYLENNKPKDFDDRVLVTTKPVKEYVSPDRKSRTIFVVGADNSVVEEERRITKELIGTFYGLGKTASSSLEFPWPENQYRSAIKVAQVKTRGGNTRAIDLFRNFIEREIKYMPGTLVLGPAVIESF